MKKQAAAKPHEVTAAEMAGEQMTLRAGHRYLELNGVEWSFQWFKTKVSLGNIPSDLVFNSRVVRKKDLDRIIEEHKQK
jgi:hypothetical protein